MYFRGKYEGQRREGEFFQVETKSSSVGYRSLLEKGSISFEKTGEVWKGDFVDFEWGEGCESCHFKLVGTITRKEGEKEKSGVWKCRDTGDVYEVVEYICDLETWEKGIKDVAYLFSAVFFITNTDVYFHM